MEGDQKIGTTLMTIIQSNVNQCKKNISLEDSFLNKFAVKRIGQLEIPPHLAYVATLPCETLMSANKPLTTNYMVV